MVRGKSSHTPRWDDGARKTPAAPYDGMVVRGNK